MFITFSPEFLRIVFITYTIWLSTVFFTILLSIKKRKTLLFYSIILSFLTSILASFIFKLPFSTSISFVLVFSLNTLYVYLATNRRLEIFAKFKPQEIFSPIFKNSFLFFTLLITTINFFTSVEYLKNNKNILTPNAFLKISRPFVPIINQQFSRQIEEILTKKLGKEANIKTREQAIRLILNETLETMSEGTIRQKLGFRPDVIPVEKVKVFPDGSIDIEPALVEAAPKIAKQINKILQNYKNWLPFLIFVITFFTLLPIMWLFDILSIFILPLLFLITFKLNLLQKLITQKSVEVLK